MLRRPTPYVCAAALLLTGGLRAEPIAVAELASASTGMLAASAAAVSIDPQQHRPHAGMLRYPDVSAGQIVFVYANDLWVVSREGGAAAPLASPPGQEMFPRFSSDGSTIAFMGNYDGNTDIYTVPASGGIPFRVTHHAGFEVLSDWGPSDSLIISTSAFAGLRRQRQLFTVSAEGGLPKKLPVPYGANGAISADGQWLAYTPHSRDARTWKRYRGGMATDIWLFHLTKHTSKRITEWEGTDTLPMWHGQKLYYLSDAGPNHRLNIWLYDTESAEREQVTNFSEYDVKWPSIGPGPDGKGEIVFQNGPGLRLLDLGSGASREVKVSIPGDRPKIRPRSVDGTKQISNGDVSSTGKRVVLEARGDIWTVPAKKGSPRNLTRTSGVAERDPAWSPDGQWIAYFSDATGEYELYITQSDGKGDTKQLTKKGKLFRYSPVWSPDSKRIAFTDKSGALYVHTIDGADTKLIDTDPRSSPIRARWSHDSNWLAYTKSTESLLSAVFLYSFETGEPTQVTSGMFNDSWPSFDRKGDFLFLASNRDFSGPMYEDLGTTFVYANTDLLLAVPLRKDVKWPLAPKSDEEEWDDEDEEDEDKEKDKDKEKEDGKDAEKAPEGDDENENGEKDKPSEKSDDESDDKKADAKKEGKDKKDDKDDEDEEKKPLVIELDGFEARAMQLPIKRGNFFNLTVSHDGKLFYQRAAPRGSGDPASLKTFDLDDEKREEKTVADGVRNYTMTADGKSLLVAKNRTDFFIIKAAPKQKLEKKIPLQGMTATLDPRAEWKQMFHDAWRIQRDFFYDPNMHGVDWPAIRKQYAKMIEDCVSTEDVLFVIGEMISELNVGHAYVRGGGDVERPPRVAVGMLGCDFELHQGAHQITRIYRGADWDVDARGPLGAPGVDVKEGDYLLAVNGVPIDPDKDPWSAFQGMADRVVTITVNEKPEIDDDARDIVVKPASSERTVRYRAWIERNRKYVEEKTDGKVGYIYVPDTGVNGQNNLFRQFYGQIHKQALIVDERWNGGGQIPTRFIELLNRPATNYWAVRHGKDWTWPPDSHLGAKCMLINGLAGSGGDCFPYYFRQAKLGKLIGLRTWGGLVGISGNPGLIDGSGTTSPTFAFYETDGTWGVEGHGVDPDIEVVDDPALMVDGGDPQLDAAIAQMLKEIQDSPYVPAKRPEYTDRSGMGIREQDK